MKCTDIHPFLLILFADSLPSIPKSSDSFVFFFLRHAYQLDTGRWHPLRLRKPKDSAPKRRKKKPKENRAPSDPGDPEYSEEEYEEDEEDPEEELSDFKDFEYNKDGREIDWNKELSESKEQDNPQKEALDHQDQLIGNGHSSPSASSSSQEMKEKSEDSSSPSASAANPEKKEKGKAKEKETTQNNFQADAENPVPCPRFNAITAVQRNLLFMYVAFLGK